jgi:arylsulfatase A-like enzyme
MRAFAARRLPWGRPPSDALRAERMARRLRLVLGIGLAMAAGETLAALALWSCELEFLVLQALIAFAVGALVFAAPLPSRALAAAPLVAIGLFHAARVLHEGHGFELVDYAILALHALATVVVVWKLGSCDDEQRRLRRALIAFAAAYVSQALWTARFVIPIALAPHASKQFAIAASITAVPLLAAWLAMRVEAHKPRRAIAIVALASIAGLPFAAYWPWLWSAHQQFDTSSANAADKRPDVLLIVLDTTRADHMSLYGYERPTTKHLEDFARTATTYEHAQSQGIWTLPGHASLFTGLYPSEHKADWLADGMNARRLSRDAVTLAERFKLGGYRTACIAANKALFGEDFGLTQGFDTAWAELGSNAQLWVPFLASELVFRVRGQSARQHIGALEQNQFASAQEINRLALHWLDDTRGRGPRLLFLNYMEAHGQLRRPPCDAPLFGDGRPFGEWDIPNVERVLAGDEDADPKKLERFRDWYDCQLACLDQHVGELLDELKQRGDFDSLLIAITADHGHMLGEHRAFKHQAEVWQGLVGVPLIIKLPGQKTAARCSEVVETADLAYALPLFAHVEVGAQVPLWAGNTAYSAAARVLANAAAPSGEVAPCPLPGRDHAAVSEAGRMGELAKKHPQRFDTSWLAILDGSKKFVIDRSGARKVADLASDPSETLRALTSDEDARCNVLVEAWRAGLITPIDVNANIDREEEARRLRALQQQGYVGR